MPQKAWSAKRERQYEHIVESEQEQGASTKKAKEIAARTVNKERARAGDHLAGRGRDLRRHPLCDGARRAEMARRGDADRRDVADYRLALGGVDLLAGLGLASQSSQLTTSRIVSPASSRCASGSQKP